MVQYYLPIIGVVVVNSLYHICAKHIPPAVNPMALLVVTYLLAAAISFTAFLATAHGDGFISQVKNITWAPIALGVCIVGLEFCMIMVYRVGWNISLASLVNSVAVAIILLVIGLAVYKEHIDHNQIIGIALCVAGLIFITRQ